MTRGTPLRKDAEERRGRELEDCVVISETAPESATLGADEKERHVRATEEEVCSYYRRLAPGYEGWVRRYPYYYERKARLLQHLIPQGGRVLEIGMGLGQNLAALNPEYGLGIDICPELVERARARYPRDKHPNLEFKTLSALDLDRLEGPFDQIILVNSITEVPDLQRLLAGIRTLCSPHTRVVQVTYNYVLAPFVRLAGRFRLAPRHPVQNWLTRYDFENLFRLSGFELIKEGADMVCPFGIPVIGNLMNRYAPLFPGMPSLSMLYYTVARPVMTHGKVEDHSVTVCVPCKNEEDNIPGLVQRIPDMGKGTEIVFVDDRSSDGTADKVRVLMEAHPEKRIKLVEGPGTGKGGACRAGFDAAENDIFMILDADMTVMPEDLPAFARTLVENHGEFVNGSRLVYPLEDGAMRLANVLGNKAFALLFSWVLSQRLKDTLCGTKVIWRRDYPKLLESRRHFGSVDRWGDYDWIFGAARHNLKIVEFPIHYRERVAGVTKMSKRFKNAAIMLRMCWIAFRKVKLI